jgi:hypothetical protein
VGIVEGVDREGSDLGVRGAGGALGLVHDEYGRLAARPLGVEPRLEETRLEVLDAREADVSVLLHHQPTTAFPARLHLALTLQLNVNKGIILFYSILFYFDKI